MLHSLTLSTFRQHTSLTVNFHSNSNAIVGDNGSGKTGILKGILFALFGATAAGNRARLPTVGHKNAKVELAITLPVHGMVLISRDLNNASVVDGSGQVLASGQAPVTAFVETALGMSFKTFKDLLYAAQGDAKALLERGATGLQKQLEQIAETDTIDAVLELITGDISWLKGALSGLGEPADLTELYALCESITKDIQAAQSEKEVTAQRVKSLSDELHNAEVAHGRAVVGQRVWLEGGQKVELAKANVNSARSALTALNSVMPERPAPFADTLPMELEQLQYEYRQKERMLQARQKLASQREAGQAHVAWLESLVEALPEWRRLSEKSETAASQLTILQDQVRQKQDWKKSLVCPTCHRASSEAELSQVSHEIDSLTEAADAKKELLAAAQDAVKAFLHSLEEKIKTSVTEQVLAGSEKQLEITRTALANVESQLLELDPEVTSESVAELMGRIANLNSDIQHHDKISKAFNTWQAQVDKASGEVAKAEVELQAAEEQYQKLAKPISNDELSALSEKITSLKETKAALDTAVVRLDAGLNSLQRDLNAAESQIKAEQARQDQIAEHLGKLADLEDLKKFLWDNRSKFMQDTWDSITNYASYLTGLITDGLMTDLRRTAGGEFLINEGELQLPVAELSGARQAIVGLSLRIALAHTFYGDKGFILLDEVTADCTEENAGRVAGVLKSLPSQIVMVTHRQMDAAAADAIISL